jgi:hypothetical protein
MVTARSVPFVIQYRTYLHVISQAADTGASSYHLLWFQRVTVQHPPHIPTTSLIYRADVRSFLHACYYLDMILN